MKLQNLIEKHWYMKSNLILSILLTPLSLIFRVIVALRKFTFTIKIKPINKLNVPVVVVGNISVGGAGKTPLTKYLAHAIEQRGIKVGIILRGYKSSNTSSIIVNSSDNSLEVGDEALIYAQAGYRVAIGAKRFDAGVLLLKKYPDIQLIIADDGLQHYYLHRDFEIAVIDSSRIFGNNHLLPAGPLREPVSRLNSVDAIVINGNYNQDKIRYELAYYPKIPRYVQNLEFIHLYNPVLKSKKSIHEFGLQETIAIAAIGNPQRFFNYLNQLGLNITKQQAYPDHYHYQAIDIPSECAIITTEKDYTKLAKFHAKNIWIAVVEAKLNNQNLVNSIINLIK